MEWPWVQRSEQELMQRRGEIVHASHWAAGHKSDHAVNLGCGYAQPCESEPNQAADDAYLALAGVDGGFGVVRVVLGS